MSDAGRAPDHDVGPPAVRELARLNRALRMLSSSNQTLIHIADEAGLVHDICRIVVEVGGYVMATIVLADPDAARTARMVAHAGPTDGSVSLAFAMRAMERGQLWLVRDIASDSDAADWRENARRAGWQAVIALPLGSGSAVLGALCIHAAADAFDAHEIEILNELAADLAFGIDTLRARAVHQRAEEDLHKAQQVFRSLVENSPDAIVRYDRNCRRTYVNPAFLRGSSAAEVELLGVSPSVRSALSAQDAAEVERLLRQVIATGVPAAMDVRNFTGAKAGTWHNLEVFPEFDRQGQVVSVMTVARDISARKRAEQEQQAHLHYFECMDRVNHVIQHATDLDQMLRELLDLMLAMFGCDRALLVWPCDPAAPSWEVPMESTQPEYPGALARHMVIPMTEDVASNMRFMLAADGPVCFGPGTEYPVPREVAEPFSIRSFVSQVVRPKLGPPWLFVVHQCAYDRIWTDDEVRLLKAIGRRLADSLTSLLVLRDLRESEGRLRTLVQTIPDLVWLKDTEGVYLACNPQCEPYFGVPEAAIIGKTDYDFVDAELADLFRASDRTAMVTGQPSIHEEWLSSADKSYRKLFETIKTPVRDAAGAVVGVLGIARDISARKTAEAEIERLAFYDPLTHLPNRRLLIDRLQRALLSSERSRLRGALLFIDLDNFKLLNDTQGHDIGDQLLIEVARRLGECVRGGDTVARLGGDEFVVILEDLSDCREEAAARAQSIAEKIHAALNRPYVVAGRAHHSTPSIGATLFLDYEVAVDELLKQADIAMYQAKATGRNTLRFYDPDMQKTLAARAALEVAMRHGIEGQQFVLHFQPQVDRSGVVGAEALLCWRHPEHGLMLPGQFIPLAEETGLILPIGQWVLRAACIQLRAWMDHPHTCDLCLAVNVSARQFRERDFVAQVQRALHDSGAPAARLKLELTESVVLDDVVDSIAKMQALKQVGVSFALDDFGTGYSSLSYLTRLPLDQLKIDQTFVRKLPESANDAAVVQTIISLGRSLGMAVIAEGVETEAQRLFLEAHGCLTWQGYLFSKPVELMQFMRFIGSATPFVAQRP